MDLGEWFFSMSFGLQMLFIVGLFFTMFVTFLLIKGIEWIFYPYKNSNVGRRYFWFH